MPWQVLTGVVEWWADEGLRDVGRGQAGSRSGSDARPLDVVDAARAVFAARREPWCLTEISLGEPHDDVTPGLAAWAGDATAVFDGSTGKLHLLRRGQTCGDLGLRRMLHPSALDALVPRPWPMRFSIPGPALERDLTLAPELVTVAAARYEATYDAGLDVLTSWEAFINGSLAQRIRLTGLRAVALG